MVEERQRPSPSKPPPVRRPTVYRTTITHTRRKPWKRTFTHRSYTWLVDLDDLPDHGSLARFEARDHLGWPHATLRGNVSAYLARHGIDLTTPAGPGRILMAAHPRAFGHCFNPISVFWCFDGDGRPAATIVEVHNTYGDRHAYLVHPDEQGRARTAKQMYVSPFHGVDGTYELAVPTPGDRLAVAVTLHTAHRRGRHLQRVARRRPDRRRRSGCGAPHGARRHPRGPPDPNAWCVALGAPVARPAKTRPPPARSVMTIDSTADSTSSDQSDLAGARRGPDRTARRGVGRGGPPPVRRRGEPPTRQRRRARPRRPPPRAGSGRPGDDRPSSRRVLRPPGPRRPDRLRRGLPDRSVGRRGPGRLPHRARRRPPDADPGVAAEGPRTGGGPPAAHPAQHRDQQPRQHRPPLRPVQRALRHLPRPDPELLLGALRHPGEGVRRAPGRDPARRRGGDRAARGGPGPQDRPAARPDRRRRRHPAARDRHRLGRAGHPGRPPRSAGPHRHALHRAARAGPPAGRRGRRRRPGAGGPAGLPGDPGAGGVRRGRRPWR